MKSENLYASQGGPIILSQVYIMVFHVCFLRSFFFFLMILKLCAKQIENEYGMVGRAFRQEGKSYVKWTAKLAVELDTGVPWVMCKQDDAPDPLVGFYVCPAMWLICQFSTSESVFFSFLIVSMVPQVNACNGRQCGETFKGPNSPNKPAIWTENWTSLYGLHSNSLHYCVLPNPQI